jgi:hypothetical protein
MPFDGRAFIRDFMCRQVLARQVFHRRRSGNKRWWEAHDLAEPLVGWVVGATYLQNGERYDGCGGGGYLLGERYDDYEPPGFGETKPRTLAYLVTPWPTRKPQPVPPEAIEVLKFDVVPSAIPESERKLRKEWGKRLPRDEKGRFISGPMLPKEDS